MCGVLGAFGIDISIDQVSSALSVQGHRGPDAQASKVFNEGVLGHNRLSIIDLDESANQPFRDESGRYWLVFNGEIYNYLELRAQLKTVYDFRTQSDSEVLLASYAVWGEAALDRLIGMFAFAIWDDREKTLFAATDRFGVKPLYYQCSPGGLRFASEIKAIQAMGGSTEVDWATWSTYLSHGYCDHTEFTFFRNVLRLRGGHQLTWSPGSSLTIKRWYRFEDRVSTDYDQRSEQEVMEEYQGLLEETTKLRFRSDVPLGVNLSGGLDSSLLLGLIHRVRGQTDNTEVFTFSTGDSRYDEIEYVREMTARTEHLLHDCRFSVEQVIERTTKVAYHQDEPFNGIPVLAYSEVFRKAQALGFKVLLDGQGMDEQWAGYDYYARSEGVAPIVQGSHSAATRAQCLTPEFAAMARLWSPPSYFDDGLRNLQYRDIFHTKIPRALRFNDRISMMYSIELREPFLDHRLVELAFRQPPERKIRNGQGKAMLRHIAKRFVPDTLRLAPKRPLQTPQREWLREELNLFRDQRTRQLQARAAHLLNAQCLETEAAAFQRKESDNSFFIWQWINLATWT